MVGIKNYVMPYNCYDCDLQNYHECDLTGESIEEDYCYNGDSREKHCPLREVEAIPKDQYEARLKADMVTMLEEIKDEVKKLRIQKARENVFGRGFKIEDYDNIIQSKINKLRGE
jgi:hypothetical protein